jgi:allophanate hydrolase subunit 2
MLIVERVFGLATVQDLGRHGRMHEAIPPGGALVPKLLVAANRRAGNPDDAAALEVLGRVRLRAEADVVTSHGPVRVGDTIEVASEHRVAYLAVLGGIDAPVVLGSRSALVSAGLGMLARAGDRIACGSQRASSSPPPTELGDLDAPIRIVPGPDAAFSDDALARLGSAPYRILPQSDRVGTRLAGPALARRPDFVETSRPMVRGAIEVPADGQPIALGPEHPTTGGYPLIAVIASDDLDRFFAIRLGASVRFAT